MHTALLLTLYLLPPGMLLALAIASSGIGGLFDIARSVFLLLLTAYAAFGIGTMITFKYRLIEHDGWRYHLRFFPMYVGIFLALWFLLGLEMRYGDPNETILRP